MTIIDQLERQGVKARSLCADSRAVAAGDIFIAMQGHQVDGRAYIADAVRRGAAAVLAEAGAETPTVGKPVVQVERLDLLAGDIANIVYGRPSERMWMAGVTGTNGKTSVSQWIAQAMSLRDCKCAVIGTLGNGYPAHLLPSPNTTPDAISLQRLLARYADEGATACTMEVSSIGLDQGRVNGVHFDVAVFTNLTRDHLEYHGSMEAYGAAKARLFEAPGLKAAVVNLDDAFGRELAQRLAGRVRTIGYTLEENSGADQVLAARKLTMASAGLAFEVDGVGFAAPVVGRFNASNLLAVTGALLAGEVKLAEIAEVLPQLAPPPGRMQVLGGVRQPLVVVDYSHSPDALEKALTTLRETAKVRGGRLICVFGCGGERDAGKRPLMGKVAEQLADHVIVTSDNPRSENPQSIVDAIVAGMSASPVIEPDRSAAIDAAVGAATVQDVILLAGKGHEPYQEIAGIRLSFSDVEHARLALENWQ